MRKIEVSVAHSNRLINNGCVILVTSRHKERSNIITLAWQTPVSHDPKLVAVCIHKKHFSHELITAAGEFVINVPDESLIKEVHFCGTISGRKVDKFKEAGLTVEEAQSVEVPLIKECFANLECQLKEVYPGGDHSIFLAQVLRAVVREDAFDGKYLKGIRTLHHLGGKKYMLGVEKVEKGTGYF